MATCNAARELYVVLARSASTRSIWMPPANAAPSHPQRELCHPNSGLPKWGMLNCRSRINPISMGEWRPAVHAEQGGLPVIRLRCLTIGGTFAGRDQDRQEISKNRYPRK